MKNKACDCKRPKIYNALDILLIVLVLIDIWGKVEVTTNIDPSLF